MSNNKILDLNEDIQDLWSFLPLDIENLYPSFLLRNCIIREDTEFYNNIAMNICHFYNFVLHTFLCRLYLANESNIEFLKYIQKTKEVFSGKDGRHKNIDICCENIKLELFNEIEKDAINYFFHLLNFDKSHYVFKTHQEITDIRNNVAHLNYTIVNKDLFFSLKGKIKKNLLFLSQKLYPNTKKIFFYELDENVRKNIIDKENYALYIAEINKKHYFSPNDYSLLIRHQLLKNVKPQSYKYFIDLYIKNELDI